MNSGTHNHCGRILSAKEKELILGIIQFCQVEKEKQRLIVPLNHAYGRVAAMCKISVSTVTRIASEFSKTGGIIPPKIKRNRKAKVTDAVNDDAIRKVVQEMNETKEHISLSSLGQRLRQQNLFTGCKTSLSRVMKRLGYSFKKENSTSNSNRKVVWEQKPNAKKRKKPTKPDETSDDDKMIEFLPTFNADVKKKKVKSKKRMSFSEKDFESPEFLAMDKPLSANFDNLDASLPYQTISVLTTDDLTFNELTRNKSITKIICSNSSPTSTLAIDQNLLILKDEMTEGDVHAYREEDYKTQRDVKTKRHHLSDDMHLSTWQ